MSLDIFRHAQARRWEEHEAAMTAQLDRESAAKANPRAALAAQAQRAQADWAARRAELQAAFDAARGAVIRAYDVLAQARGKDPDEAARAAAIVVGAEKVVALCEADLDAHVKNQPRSW